MTFECTLCGETRDAEDGALDDVERYLGDAERGVCNDCFARLPDYVKSAAEDWANCIDHERSRAAADGHR